MPSHDDIVTVAEMVADYFRELVRNGLPPDEVTTLLLGFQEQLVWHDLLGHCADVPEREPWENDGDG